MRWEGLTVAVMGYRPFKKNSQLAYLRYLRFFRLITREGEFVVSVLLPTHFITDKVSKEYYTYTPKKKSWGTSAYGWCFSQVFIHDLKIK